MLVTSEALKAQIDSMDIKRAFVIVCDELNVNAILDFPASEINVSPYNESVLMIDRIELPNMTFRNVESVELDEHHSRAYKLDYTIQCGLCEGCFRLILIGSKKQDTSRKENEAMERIYVEPMRPHDFKERLSGRKVVYAGLSVTADEVPGLTVETGIANPVIQTDDNSFKFVSEDSVNSFTLSNVGYIVEIPDDPSSGSYKYEIACYGSPEESDYHLTLIFE